MNKEKSLNVRVPADLQKQLIAASKQEHIPVSDLVRLCLRRFLAVREFRRLRRKTLPQAREQGFWTDDDIFSIVS